VILERDRPGRSRERVTGRQVPYRPSWRCSAVDPGVVLLVRIGQFALIAATALLVYSTAPGSVGGRRFRARWPRGCAPSYLPLSGWRLRSNGSSRDVPVRGMSWLIVPRVKGHPRRAIALYDDPGLVMGSAHTRRPRMWSRDRCRSRRPCFESVVAGPGVVVSAGVGPVGGVRSRDEPWTIRKSGCAHR